MSNAFLVIAFGYATLAFVTFQFERRRIRTSGIDVTTVFIGLTLVQSVIPGIVIFATLPFVDTAGPTGVTVFDSIYQRADLTTASAVLMLTAWFLLFVYVGAGLVQLLLRGVARSEGARGLSAAAQDFGRRRVGGIERLDRKLRQRHLGRRAEHGDGRKHRQHPGVGAQPQRL